MRDHVDVPCVCGHFSAAHDPWPACEVPGCGCQEFSTTINQTIKEKKA